jgi:hypothetical protein
MAIEIKNLATGWLRLPSSEGFVPGGRVLYAAPRIGEFGATVNKTALVTGMRFVKRASGAATMNLHFVRYDSTQPSIGLRPRRHIVGVNLSLGADRNLLEIDLPLTLEEGDAIVGDSTPSLFIQYILSGVEMEVS